MWFFQRKNDSVCRKIRQLVSQLIKTQNNIKILEFQEFLKIGLI